MQQIKIFRKELEDPGNGAFTTIEDTVNKWLKKNKDITVQNMFSANMHDEYGDGQFVIIAVYTNSEGGTFLSM